MFIWLPLIDVARFLLGRAQVEGEECDHRI